VFLRLVDPSGSQVTSQNTFNRSGVAKTINIASYDGGLQDSGVHYVSVTMTAEDVSGTVPFDLVVQVSGEPTADEPTASPTPTPTAEPTDEPTEEPATEAVGGDDDGSGVPGWVYAVLAVLALAVLALGGLVVVLLRRVKGTTQT
jgi:hypothetical protein